MEHEELKNEKLESCKQDMYEDMLHEKYMKENISYLLIHYVEPLSKANDILQAVSNELWTKYSIEMSPIDLLKEM